MAILRTNDEENFSGGTAEEDRSGGGEGEARARLDATSSGSCAGDPPSEYFQDRKRASEPLLGSSCPIGRCPVPWAKDPSLRQCSKWRERAVYHIGYMAKRILSGK